MRDIHASVHPDNVQVVKNEDNRSFTLVLWPFERGFGHTIGYVLRRILLSSMPGAAITEARIDGVLHEYATVDGMQEDVAILLLNLKQVIFRMPEREEADLLLQAKGPGPMRAGDIALEHGVEVVNPDFVIAHLSASASISMRLKVQRGRGYEPASVRYNSASAESKPVGVLPLDATYSPVLRVAYRVENARLGDKTNLDKLILDLETDGSVGPKDCVTYAATLLQYQLSAFSRGFVERSIQEVEGEESKMDPLLDHEISALDVPPRALNCLRMRDVKYIGSLVQFSKLELLKTPHLGEKSLAEIGRALVDIGLNFEMNVGSWTPPTEEEKT